MRITGTFATDVSTNIISAPKLCTCDAHNDSTSGTGRRISLGLLKLHVRLPGPGAGGTDPFVKRHDDRVSDGASQLSQTLLALHDDVAHLTEDEETEEEDDGADDARDDFEHVVVAVGAVARVEGVMIETEKVKNDTVRPAETSLREKETAFSVRFDVRMQRTCNFPWLP